VTIAGICAQTPQTPHRPKRLTTTFHHRSRESTAQKPSAANNSILHSISSMEETSNGEGGGNGAESVQELARKGSTAVRRLKRMTVGVLIGASLSIAGLVYVTSVNDEKRSFESTVRVWHRGKICACRSCSFPPMRLNLSPLSYSRTGLVC
jgi:hypothetical protein